MSDTCRVREIIRDKGTDRSRSTWRLIRQVHLAGPRIQLRDGGCAGGHAAGATRSTSRCCQRRRRAFDWYEAELVLRSQRPCPLAVNRPGISTTCCSRTPRTRRISLPTFARAAAVLPTTCSLNQSPSAGGTGLMCTCPVAESAASRLVRLPLHAELSDADSSKHVAWSAHGGSRRPEIACVPCALSS